MMKPISVSIIVPVYNVEEYLDKCIRSICEQTYHNIEIILVDDGSIDGSSGICDKWASLDKRIICIHTPNGGRVCARKIGATYAHGDYITTVDGDDWIEPDRVENLVSNGLTGQEDMVFLSGWIKEYPGRQELGELAPKFGLFSKSTICGMLSDTDKCFKRSINPSMCCMAVRGDIFLEAISEIDNRIQMGDDVTFTWMALLKSEYIRIIEDNRYHYVQRSGSINHTLSSNDIELIRLSYEQVKDNLISKNAEKSMFLQMAFTYSRLLASVGDKSYFGCDERYLFPYISIKKGSSVVVYGAGDVGSKLVAFLQESESYCCTGWIDKYTYGRVVGEIVSEDIDMIASKEYDYIAIAVVSADTAISIKCELMKRGIASDKIALMSPDAISIEITEKCLRG